MNVLIIIVTHKSRLNKIFSIITHAMKHYSEEYDELYSKKVYILSSIKT